MPTVRLTHRGIASLTAGRWLTDYWDDLLPGFGVRVSQKGTKSYVVRYTGDHGKRRRLTLGRYPALPLADARDRAREILYAIRRGDDPQADRQAERAALPRSSLTSRLGFRFVPHDLRWPQELPLSHASWMSV